MPPRIIQQFVPLGEGPLEDHGEAPCAAGGLAGPVQPDASLTRSTRRPQHLPEYDDAFFHAVQDAWHLKDWIQNDESDPAIDRSLHAKIVAEAHTRDAIRIIADLANCTKHLVQRDHPKAGAELDGTDAEAKMGTGQSKRWFRVRLRTGAMREGTELIDEAIAAWDELLKHHGFL